MREEIKGLAGFLVAGVGAVAALLAWAPLARVNVEAYPCPPLSPLRDGPCGHGGSRRAHHGGHACDNRVRRPVRRPVHSEAVSDAVVHAKPSGSVKAPASLPIASRCDPVPSGEMPATLARPRRL